MNPALTNNFTTALERAKAIADKLRAKKRELEEEEKQLTPAEKKQKKESTVVKYKPVLKSIDMDIASHMAALVVGRNGEQLRNLETSCNVRITITDEPIEDQRTVTISGEELSVAEARNRIDDIVNGSGSLALLMGGQAPTGHQTIYVQVPTSRVGLVIGRGGETIRSLQEKTGAKVNVCKDGEMDNPPDTKTVVVNGPPHCIAAAQQLIDEIVSGKVYGVPFGVIGISEIIHVPKDKVGLVIGKGGETIQIIQNLCNVKLNIDANSDKNEQRPVTISGTPECIQSAKEQIYERIPGEGQELGELFNAEYAASDPAYSAAYGTGVPPAYKQKVDQAALLGYDPQTYQAYVEYYAQYYASLGYGEDFGDDNGINGS